MKFVVQDISELKDSRELLESKPHPFTTIFIYIILAIMTSTLTWSWFGEKEIVVKARGIIRPNEDIYKVNNIVNSKVLKVNFKNGQNVKKDDILYILDHEELDIQREATNKNIDKIKLDIQNLNKLKNSINDDNNYFDENNENEKVYYNKYVNYKKGNQTSELDIKNSEVNKSELNLKIENLKLLQKSINEDKNYLMEEDIFYEQFNSYNISAKGYKDRISKNQELYQSLKVDENKNREQLLKLEYDVKTYELSLEKLKNEWNLKIKSSIEEIQNNIKQVDNSIVKANNTIKISTEKGKASIILQIEDDIKADEDRVKELEEKLKEIDRNIDKFTEKAPSEGILDIQTDIKNGDLVQAGAVIANIIPLQSKYKVDLYIADKDIANIKEGQEIKYNLPSLPYKEYGFVKGSIENISADSKVSQQNRVTFYTAKGCIENSKLYSHKGEESEIKNGMSCEAQIVTRKVKMLYYVLEKINLKD